jgi:hypothetical protein
MQGQRERVVVREVLLGMLAFAQQSFVAGKNLLEVLDLLMPVWCGLCYFVVVSLLFVGYDLQSRNYNHFF